MPLYCKVVIQSGDSQGSEAKAALRDLPHEGRKLIERQPTALDPLLFATPQLWHKSFLDELLRPDDWSPPAGRKFPFRAADILRLCDAVEAKLKGEPSLLEVQAPVKVFGDIHGQFADLMNLFKAYGSPSRLGDIGMVDYLFLGDYVDRGEYSLETICLLFALKVEFPGSVHLLRGNHEVWEVNERYGFQEECRRRLGAAPGWEVWHRINQVFCWMPLAARIDKKILCMHGGISPELLQSCDQIAAIKRPLSMDDVDSEDTLLASQLLWNDPNDTDAVLGSHASSRGLDIRTFSAQHVEEFCRDNGLDLIIRAHECVKDGIERFARGRLITVFSATNYCGRYENAGALLLVGRDHVVVPKVLHPSLAKSLAQKSPAAAAAAAGAGAGAGADGTHSSNSHPIGGPYCATSAAATASYGDAAAASSHVDIDTAAAPVGRTASGARPTAGEGAMAAAVEAAAATNPASGRAGAPLPPPPEGWERRGMPFFAFGDREDDVPTPIPILAPTAAPIATPTPAPIHTAVPIPRESHGLGEDPWEDVPLSLPPPPPSPRLLSARPPPPTPLATAPAASFPASALPPTPPAAAAVAVELVGGAGVIGAPVGKSWLSHSSGSGSSGGGSSSSGGSNGGGSSSGSGIGGTTCQQGPAGDKLSSPRTKVHVDAGAAAPQPGFLQGFAQALLDNIC